MTTPPPGPVPEAAPPPASRSGAELVIQLVEAVGSSRLDPALKRFASMAGLLAILSSDCNGVTPRFVITTNSAGSPVSGCLCIDKD